MKNNQKKDLPTAVATYRDDSVENGTSNLPNSNSSDSSSSDNGKGVKQMCSLSLEVNT